ncbi:MAG TPA: hypothetical protein VLH86_04620 [Patescibacteria group bacterium]|nr:hypothetical protein [Patescibacteria group bacterium]
MSKNVKGLLAAIIALIVFGSFSGYAYFAQHQHMVVGLALIAGILLAGIDWALRKPGRTPNKVVMSTAYIIGILGGPVVHLLWGENTQFSIAVYLSSLCLPLVAYILLATCIFASKRPGYWGR